jgi:methyltransferase (TIGR00027 family)
VTEKKIKIEAFRDVSETLLLPLYFRAIESRRPDPLVKDELADRIIEKIDYDFSKLEGLNLTHIATLMRVRAFDRFTQDFLARHPHSTIVNIGCGLDTRFFRVGNGTEQWYQLDFPEVIALRRRLIDEPPRCHLIASSVLDFACMDVLGKPNITDLLFLAEGVLMYLTEKDVKKIVSTLARKFPGATLIFDAVSPLQALLSYIHPAIITTDARFCWGLGNARELESWFPGIQLMEEFFYFDQPERRLGSFNLLRLWPAITRGFSILRCRLGRKS